MGSESRSAFVDVLKVQKGVAQSLGLSQGASVGSGLPRNGAPMTLGLSNPDYEARASQ